MKLRHPLVAVLAQWEDENGTMAAILPDEWMKLHAAVTQACIEESPRMLRAALAEPVDDEPVARVYYDCGECPYPTSGCPDRCAKSTRPAAAPAEQLRRGITGVCSKGVCECEREGYGDKCIWLRPTDAELERRTGEPHIDGYPLYSGLPPPPAERGEYPPLPAPRKPDEHGLGWFTAGQMRAYVDADRAWLIGPPTIEQRKQISALLRSQAAEIEALQKQIANLKTVMIAAAEEIHAHWDAHCDAEGYGPQNLMRRLEEGIPSEYGYTAGAFEALRADAERLEWLERWLFEKRWNGVIGSGSQTDWTMAGNWRHITVKMRGQTFRAAIDAARKG